MENYWEDDDDSFSSEQEGSDDAVPPQVIDSSKYLFSWQDTPVPQVKLITLMLALVHLVSQHMTSGLWTWNDYNCYYTS